tara:strand:+ start:895 stop:1272 length:378 start_codon:yes stop_codon:yes gene_type:complete
MTNLSYQNIPDPPLLCRQSNNKCKTCESNTSLSSHKYCLNCCAKPETDAEDKIIRCEIILYHLMTTYKNERGIQYFNKPKDIDNDQVKRYLKVLSKSSNFNFIIYFNDGIISEKINDENYFRSIE